MHISLVALVAEPNVNSVCFQCHLTVRDCLALYLKCQRLRPKVEKWKENLGGIYYVLLKFNFLLRCPSIESIPQKTEALVCCLYAQFILRVASFCVCRGMVILKTW